MCNLLGNCDGTGAAPRTESRTQAHDSLIVVSDTQSMLAEPVLRHLFYGSGAVLRYSIGWVLCWSLVHGLGYTVSDSRRGGLGLVFADS